MLLNQRNSLVSYFCNSIIIMQIDIRQEQETDYESTQDVVRLAFAGIEHSDQNEHHLVNALRKSEAFIPELSLVALHNQTIVGHILLTRIGIIGTDKTISSLALAPVSVLPKYQGKGIGAKLILRAHHLAEALGHESIILLGHADYYPRFGYQKASLFGIQMPFDVPDENAMAIELKPNALAQASGKVKYDPAFGIE